jgi:hypothetical protein
MIKLQPTIKYEVECENIHLRQLFMCLMGIYIFIRTLQTIVVIRRGTIPTLSVFLGLTPAHSNLAYDGLPLHWLVVVIVVVVIGSGE